MSSVASDIEVPDLTSGRRSKREKQELDRFADVLREIDSGIDFKMSARGWGYYLEGANVIDKSELDEAQHAVNVCRDSSRVPVDFTASDDARAFEHGESVNFGDAESYGRAYLSELQSAAGLDVSFWEEQGCYIQVLVEKVDLRELFAPVCAEYNIPIATSKGWPSKLQRAKMIARFAQWEQKGKIPILLLAGDFDPAGKQITDKYEGMLDQPDWIVPTAPESEAPPVYTDSGERATHFPGWTPDSLIIERFALEQDQIEEASLTWINNLITGSGKDLADPEHKEHQQEYVQDWLAKVGEQKCEANALVTEPERARDIIRDKIEENLVLARNAVASQQDGAEWDNEWDPLAAYETAEKGERKELMSLFSETGLDEAIDDTLTAIDEGRLS